MTQLPTTNATLAGYLETALECYQRALLYAARGLDADSAAGQEHAENVVRAVIDILRLRG